MLDQPVTMKGKAKPWTLGNYLLLMKKGASSVKMGVAYTVNKVNVLCVYFRQLSAER